MCVIVTRLMTAIATGETLDRPGFHRINYLVFKAMASTPICPVFKTKARRSSSVKIGSTRAARPSIKKPGAEQDYKDFWIPS